MQAQAVVHVGVGENMMNQMATFCLGERAHPLPHWSGTTDQAQVTRRKRLRTWVLHLLSDLWPSWIANTPSSTLATMASTISLAV